MFRLGCSVLRRHAGDVFDPARVRRAVGIAAAAVVISVVAMVGLEARLGWTHTGPVRSVVAIALLALGVGLFVLGCVPARRPLDPAATINGRQVRIDWRLAARPATKRYFGWRAVPVDPSDRDAVLADAVLLRRGLTGLIGRAAPLLGALAFAVVGFRSAGFEYWLPVFWVVLYGCSLVGYVADLGRTERARLAARALPEPATTD
ncbi:hypothetical protein JOE58_003137 [Curtobacterium luteum]|uniref:Uncharacterized protein n=1 Tax=Curtobacterium luteum TaxID=33881 RepID=A0A8H9GC38_9MICO|nr:hypothetical protein [Curtobacterium luteum]MBM7803886.1 hypothetical protein [Curtobacterium luteum]NUU51393.1 hypothetical protein [Curtobacterium luteum]GGL04768.1 hypothetical protein GCM10009769_23540 [Curtobacterium luteum]